MPPYRPITDVWILARTKLKYYGAYPAGFLHRARLMIGASPNDPVLHVCSGKIRDYKCGPICPKGHYHGFGKNDRTLDLDPACEPDFLQDARQPFPFHDKKGEPWRAVLIDRPYSEEDAKRYVPGADKLPDLNQLLKNGLAVVEKGSLVGILDYTWPHPGSAAREVAAIAVGTGRNNRARWFTVWEKL